jgi:hypothetical protein
VRYLATRSSSRASSLSSPDGALRFCLPTAVWMGMGIGDGDGISGKVLLHHSAAATHWPGIC